MFCGKCGAQVNETDKFCAECGAPIERAQETTFETTGEPAASPVPAAEPAPVPAAEPAPKKKSHKALWIVLTCVALAAVLAAVLIVWHPWSRNSARINPEETVRAAFEALNDVDSMHLDFSETVSMSIGLASVNYKQDMDIAIVLSVDTNKNPVVSRTEGYMDMLGQRQTFLMYSEEVDGKTKTYRSSDDGKTWEQEDVELDGSSILQNPAEAVDLWMKHAKDFKTVGTETLNGYKTTVISGTLSGEYVREATGMTGDLFGALDEDVFEGLDDLPIKFWVDNDSGCIVRMYLDMQDMMKTLLEKAMEKSMGELPEGMELSVEVGEATVDCVITQFNEVPPIVIPDGAKSTAPAPESDSIVGTWTLSGGEDEQTQQYVDMMLGLGMDMVFVFNEDGTGSVSTTFQDEEDKSEFNYTLENGEIVIDGSGAPYRIEDGYLYLTADSAKLVFKRK